MQRLQVTGRVSAFLFRSITHLLFIHDEMRHFVPFQKCSGGSCICRPTSFLSASLKPCLDWRQDCRSACGPWHTRVHTHTLTHTPAHTHTKREIYSADILLLQNITQYERASSTICTPQQKAKAFMSLSCANVCRLLGFLQNEGYLKQSTIY